MCRRAAVRLGLGTFTSIEFFLKLSITELAEIASEIEEANKNNGK